LCVKQNSAQEAVGVGTDPMDARGVAHDLKPQPSSSWSTWGKCPFQVKFRQTHPTSFHTWNR